MGAIITTTLLLLSSGDHIVAQRDLYGAAWPSFSPSCCRSWGFETTLFDTTDYDQHARAIRPHTKLVYLESPTNPSQRIVDMKKAAPLAKAHGLA